MRIVGGAWRGRRLKSPGEIKGVRPTSDRLREALFNILAARVRGCSFVDLYAGPGAVGLEAASRGAAEVVLVERARRAQVLCLANIEACRAGERVTLRKASAERPGALPIADIAFADPPYAQAAQTSLDTLLSVRVVPGGCWCLELAADSDPPQPPVGVAVVLDRVYGGSRLIIYEQVD